MTAVLQQDGGQGWRGHCCPIQRKRGLAGEQVEQLLGAAQQHIGFFYAFACSVMVGLARTDDRTFVATMQWINATVRNAAFAPAFFGALLVTAAAAVIDVRNAALGR